MVLMSTFRWMSILVADDLRFLIDLNVDLVMMDERALLLLMVVDEDDQIILVWCCEGEN